MDSARRSPAAFETLRQPGPEDGRLNAAVTTLSRVEIIIPSKKLF